MPGGTAGTVGDPGAGDPAAPHRAGTRRRPPPAVATAIAPVAPGRGTADGYALPAPRCRCEARRTGTAASIPRASTAAASCATSTSSTAWRCRAQVREQFRVGKNVDRDRLEPGDLVFFSTVAPGASHVGIVIGGDQFIHAPSERGVVRVESLSAQYWASRFIGAKRVS